MVVEVAVADAVAVAEVTVVVATMTVAADAVAVAEAIVAVVAATTAVDALDSEMVVAAAAMIQNQTIEVLTVLRKDTGAKPEVRRTNLPRIRKKAMATAKQTGITGLQRADSSVRAEANDRVISFLFSE